MALHNFHHYFRLEAGFWVERSLTDQPSIYLVVALPYSCWSRVSMPSSFAYVYETGQALSHAAEVLLGFMTMPSRHRCQAQSFSLWMGCRA